jgi:hypothetical protein
MRASDILPPKEMQEARKLRDAEERDPGVIRRALLLSVCRRPQKKLPTRK